MGGQATHIPASDVSSSVIGANRYEYGADQDPFRDVSDDEDEDVDALHEVIMAIEMKDNGSVGCSYYIAMEETLFLQEDIPMAGMELVETLLIHVEPTTVIIANRAPEKLARFLEDGMQDMQGNNNGTV